MVKNPLEMIQACPEDRSSLSTMRLYCDGCALVEDVSRLVTPAKGERQDAEQLRQAFSVPQMSLFEIETTAFHGLKHCLDLPSLQVICDSVPRLSITDNHHQLITFFGCR